MRKYGEERSNLSKAKEVVQETGFYTKQNKQPLKQNSPRSRHKKQWSPEKLTSTKVFSPKQKISIMKPTTILKKPTSPTSPKYSQKSPTPIILQKSILSPKSSSLLVPERSSMLLLDSSFKVDLNDFVLSKLQKRVKQDNKNFKFVSVISTGEPRDVFIRELKQHYLDASILGAEPTETVTESFEEIGIKIHFVDSSFQRIYILEVFSVLTLKEFLMFSKTNGTGSCPNTSQHYTLKITQVITFLLYFCQEIIVLPKKNYSDEVGCFNSLFPLLKLIKMSYFLLNNAPTSAFERMKQPYIAPTLAKLLVLSSFKTQQLTELLNTFFSDISLTVTLFSSFYDEPFVSDNSNSSQLLSPRSSTTPKITENMWFQECKIYWDSIDKSGMSSDFVFLMNKFKILFY